MNLQTTPNEGQGQGQGPAAEATDLHRRLRARPERRWLRTRAGLSLLQIAEEVGASESAVSRWEDGNRVPRGRNLRGYVEILDRLAEEARS